MPKPAVAASKDINKIGLSVCINLHFLLIFFLVAYVSQTLYELKTRGKAKEACEFEKKLSLMCYDMQMD
jgi:hypothetical protein